MILKIISDNEKGTYYYESDNFRHYHSTLNKARKDTEGLKESVFIIHNNKDNIEVDVFELYNKTELIGIIITSCIVYVMNDKGSTFDRYN